MGLAPTDSIAIGLFAFRDTAGFPEAARQTTAFAASSALSLRLRVPLAPGRFAISLEAYSRGTGAAALMRDSIRAPVWTPDSLLLSDLLAADRVEAVPGTEPLAVQDLRIDANPALTFLPSASVWAVWEVYGAARDSERVARYEVTLTLADLNRRSLPIRLLARLGVVGGGRGPTPSIRWAVERRPAPDGRTLEYVAVQLPADARGQYDLRVTVTDSAGHRSATANRRITVTAPQ